MLSSDGRAATQASRENVVIFGLFAYTCARYVHSLHLSTGPTPASRDRDRRQPLATYVEIQDRVRLRYGMMVKTCWIADVKELNGLPLCTAWDSRSLERRENPCVLRWRATTGRGVSLRRRG